MEIPVYPNQPTCPGLYVVKWHGTGCVGIVTLLDGDDGLFAVGGASTHYTRWQCSWSEPIEIVAPYGIPALK